MAIQSRTMVPEGRTAQRRAGRGAARTRNGVRAGRPPLGLGVLNDHLGYFVRRLQVWVFQDFMRALDGMDVRPAQYSVLAVIEANPGSSQSDVAEFLGIERARFVRLLDRLERRGFTERRRSPTDRRSHALYLTREGQRALKRIKARAAEHEVQLSAKLGREKRDVLIELLRDFGP